MISNYSNNNVNFRGYDARPLKALVMRKTMDFDLTKISYEMREIGAKHGFNVIVENKTNCFKIEDLCSTVLKKIKAFLAKETAEYLHPWVQDILYFTKDKMLITKSESTNHTALCKNMNIIREEIVSRDFIEGGNLFLLQNGNTEKILVGKSEKLKKVTKLFPEREITQLPQADFHIDLFVRPLKDNVIIAADDDLTLTMLQSGKYRLEKLLDQSNNGKLKDVYNKLCSIIEDMQQARNQGDFANTNKVIATLENNGYTVIKTPGRIYNNKACEQNPGGIFIHRLNFINAVAAIDKNGEIVYISNKTTLPEELGLTPELAEKTGLDFETIFKKSVGNYIKPENIYFIKGGDGAKDKVFDNIQQIFKEAHGGIHCLCAEIPNWQS